MILTHAILNKIFNYMTGILNQKKQNMQYGTVQPDPVLFKIDVTYFIGKFCMVTAD